MATDIHTVAADLLEQYALVPTRASAPVAPISARSIHDGLTIQNFRLMMQPYTSVAIGPRGGERITNPVDLWIGSDLRVTAEGLRLRPDMPRPIYQEGGKVYINIYAPPEHPATGGEHETGLEFMQQLLPDAAERNWFMKFLAFKYRNPGVPGPGVIMVAKRHGTGRGTLGEIIRRLVGLRYVKTIPFDIFAGRNYQSQYNDWAADSLVVLVNESSTAEGGRYNAKRDTYERMKDLVEPRPIERHFIVKGLPAFNALSFTTYIIATNHADALPIPADDRRFAVLTNGEPRTPEFWKRINDWLEEPTHIGAFARYLERLDLGDYSPYASPLHTHAKAMMTDLADSDIDRGFQAALEALPAELIVESQLIDAMVRVRSEQGLDYNERWQTVAKRDLSSKLERIGVTRGRNWQMTFDGRRQGVFARDRDAAKRWTFADPQEIKDELARNAVIPGSASINALRGLRLVRPLPES